MAVLRDSFSFAWFVSIACFPSPGALLPCVLGETRSESFEISSLESASFALIRVRQR